MLAIPAIDLRDSQCVQLVEGDYSKEALRLDDPVQVARRWLAAGFSRLHVVDLDAATGRGDNRPVVRDLLMHIDAPMQVGGGVRDDDAIAALLGEGADRIVIGTRGITDPAWLVEQAFLAPGRIILAADVRERVVVLDGWARTSTRSIRDVVAAVEDAPLAGLLVTAVHREGKLQGTDLALYESLVGESPWPVIASGGIASMQELRNLEERGVSECVLGMALYTEAVDPRVVAEEFAA